MSKLMIMTIFSLAFLIQNAKTIHCRNEWSFTTTTNSDGILEDVRVIENVNIACSSAIDTTFIVINAGTDYITFSSA